MGCENVQERISLLLDGKLTPVEREHVLAHTDVCRPCDTYRESMETQRVLLRNLAHAQVPKALATQLRVLASHERERQLARVSFGTRVRRWVVNVELAFDNLMRPVALPVTGGLVSTLLIFALLMPKLSFSHETGAHEPSLKALSFFGSTFPTGSLESSPWNQGVDENSEDPPRFSSPDQPTADPESDYVNIVNLVIDESGKVVDWTVVRGHLTEEITSIILFSRFQPATDLGRTTSGTIQVRQGLLPCKYRRCSATVRG